MTSLDTTSKRCPIKQRCTTNSISTLTPRQQGKGPISVSPLALSRGLRSYFKLRGRRARVTAPSATPPPCPLGGSPPPKTNPTRTRQESKPNSRSIDRLCQGRILIKTETGHRGSSRNFSGNGKNKLFVVIIIFNSAKS